VNCKYGVDPNEWDVAYSNMSFSFLSLGSFSQGYTSFWPLHFLEQILATSFSSSGRIEEVKFL